MFSLAPVYCNLTAKSTAGILKMVKGMDPSELVLYFSIYNEFALCGIQLQQPLFEVGDEYTSVSLGPADVVRMGRQCTAFSVPGRIVRTVAHS